MNSLSLTEKKAFWLVAAVMAVVVISARLHTVYEPFERDITGHAYVGHQILEGKTLYTEIWDHKPPAMHYLFALSELIFGYNDWAIYAVNASFAAAALIFLGLVAREIAGFYPALITLTFYGLLLQSPDVQSNQPNTEMMINAFKFLGFYLLLRAFRAKGSAVRPILIISLIAMSGFAIGVASAFKMIVLFTFLAMAAMITAFGDDETRAGTLKNLLVFSAGAGAVWFIILIQTVAAGSFHDFYDAVFVFNREYTIAPWRSMIQTFVSPSIIFGYDLRWEYPFAVLACAFLGTLVIGEGRHMKLVVILAFLAACLEYAAPGHFYPHYYQLLVPFLALMSAWAIRDVYRSAAPRWRIVFASILALAVVIPLIGRNIEFLETPPEKICADKYATKGIDIFGSTRQLGIFMRETFKPNLTLFQLANETGLYYYSKFDAPTRYFYLYPLLQGSEERKKRVADEIYDDLTRNPPDVFINTRFDTPEKQQMYKRHDLDAYLSENYSPYGTFSLFTIYCNKKFVTGEGESARCNLDK